MELVRKPSELSADGPGDENWNRWKQEFTTFVKASGADEWPTDRKASLLMNWIGPVGYEISKKFSPEDFEDMDTLMKRFAEHFGSQVTEARQRYVFFSSERQRTDTIDHYVNTLKIKAKVCNFGDLMDSLIRDKIILDIKDEKLRQHLLNETESSLDQTVDLWKKFEKNEEVKNLYSIKIRVNKTKSNSSVNNLDGSVNGGTSKCGRCGTQHDPKHCPARGQKCENCGMQNHLAKCCTKPSTPNNNTREESKAPKHFNPGPFAQIPGSNRKNI